MIVKICGLTNLEDALAAAGCGATALGFNFFPLSPRYIPPEQAARIIERLPEMVWKVGVFVDAPPEEINRVRRLAGLDIVQLHGNEPPEMMPLVGRAWKALRVDAGFTPARFEPYQAEAFVLDAACDTYGGSGRSFDWNLARNAGRPVVLAGGLDENNVRQAIRTVRPWGVDACSRLESAPGKKDHARMARFIKAALEEETS